MGDDIIQMYVTGNKVGIIGLADIFQELEERGLKNEKQIKKLLVGSVRAKNYVPSSKELEYGEALLQLYKRHLGESVEEARHGLEIRILGPGCYNCENCYKLHF